MFSNLQWVIQAPPVDIAAHRENSRTHTIVLLTDEKSNYSRNHWRDSLPLLKNLNDIINIGFVPSIVFMYIKTI